MNPLHDCLIPVSDVPPGRTRTHRMLAAAEPSLPLPALVRRGAQPAAVSVREACRALRAVTAQCGGLTVDVETSGYPVGHTHYLLRTVQLGDAGMAVVFDATDPAQAGTIRELLASAPRLCAHSAVADLVPLAYAGLIDPGTGWDRVHDTVICAKLADPASTGSDPGLKHLAAAVLGPQAVTPAADAARSALFRAGGWLTGTTTLLTCMQTHLHGVPITAQASKPSHTWTDAT